ncbi:type IV pili signal transduction protein [Massilia sp. WF1]|uniref:chemotaxis protein CheW n=1 Tax=unclassified Massilia TaxID=2609279 RepID=UPI0006493C31|nr:MULTISPECIES: chemotaxis protein CheW [unclassified Massilia]ALK98855.1 type IV pili signal transduction protein [Massilia sp. WG5]KLU38597.1 type IV pili signal transduction protein [Massilia sp. WF1]
MASLDPAARRARLRQYQEELLERMQAARTGSGRRTHQLGVEIGGERYLLDLLEAGEIVPVPALTTVPLTQPWYLGLANIRGSLVGVVDLARFFGAQGAQDGAPAGPAARLVTFAPGLGLPCGFLAARVHGLRQAADMRPQDGRLVDPDGNAWTPLALAALAQDERFLQVGL